MADHVLAIDQGTTSTRAIVFDASGAIVAVAQREHEQIIPRAGWVEHDPVEIWTNTQWVIAAALATRGSRRATSPASASPISARRRSCGTAAPASPSPTRSSGRTPARSRASTGSPPTAAPTGSRPRPACRSPPTSRHRRSPGSSTTSPGARAAAEAGHLLFGTPDTWLVWNLTGGRRGGIHVTDVTNASRTLLMDLRDARLVRRAARGVGHPAVDDARHPLVVRGRRRGARAAGRARHADRGHPRRPAGRDLRPGRVRRRCSRRTPTAPATSCS